MRLATLVTTLLLAGSASAQDQYLGLSFQNGFGLTGDAQPAGKIIYGTKQQHDGFFTGFEAGLAFSGGYSDISKFHVTGLPSTGVLPLDLLSERDAVYRREFKSDAALTGSFTLGKSFGDIDIFTQFTGGASVVTKRTTIDDRNSKYCDAYVSLGFPFPPIECVSSHAGTKTSDSSTGIAPTLALTAGGQYNFDRYFVRLSGTYGRTFMPSADYGSGSTQVSFAGTLGFKF